MSNNINNNEYIEFINDIKTTIIKANIKVVRTINSSLIELYYEIGKSIIHKQKESKWGDAVIDNIEQDLKIAFPNLKGFSRRNIFYMKAFVEFTNYDSIVQQAAAQIPWGHLMVLMDKKLHKEISLFYINKTIQNSWSRSILELQIESNLYARQGSLPNNFEKTLDIKDFDLIKETFKDPYILDFLELDTEHKERDLEQALVSNITKFLLELGIGFAFVGQQYKITVSTQEFFVDLLFYHIHLKRYVVIELKTKEFKPDQVGQIGFYITAINRQIKREDDNNTIGIIICKNKDDTIVEYALDSTTHPTGVSTFTIEEQKIIKELPTSQDFEKIITLTENEYKNDKLQ
jgi:predicted nuclease of restriction endonuclease-like (RecB) superfamily